MYTSHGHHITGTPLEDEPPSRVTRCGGAGLCGLCSQEIASYIKSRTTQEKFPAGSLDQVIYITKQHISNNYNIFVVELDMLSFSRANQEVIAVILWPLKAKMFLINHSMQNNTTSISEFAWVKTEDI
jgi:hypothetical protein